MAERFVAHLKDLRGPLVEKRCRKLLHPEFIIKGNTAQSAVGRFLSNSKNFLLVHNNHTSRNCSIVELVGL